MNPRLLLLSHLLVIGLSVFLVSSSPSPSPDPYPAVISLPARQAQQAQSTAASTVSPPEVEHDLLPFVLVATIDGALHAVDRDGGDIRWSLQEGISPLIGGGVAGSDTGEDYIVEPLSGNLYVLEEGDEPEGEPRVRKLPLSVEKL
jgi:serine/threonine-protein kinase/endoribonuclease IRE1